MSDDVINKEKVISETGNDLSWKPNSQTDNDTKSK